MWLLCCLNRNGPSHGIAVGDDAVKVHIGAELMQTPTTPSAPKSQSDDNAKLETVLITFESQATDCKKGVDALLDQLTTIRESATQIGSEIRTQTGIATTTIPFLGLRALNSSVTQDDREIALAALLATRLKDSTFDRLKALSGQILKKDGIKPKAKVLLDRANTLLAQADSLNKLVTANPKFPLGAERVQAAIDVLKHAMEDAQVLHCESASVEPSSLIDELSNHVNAMPTNRDKIKSTTRALNASVEEFRKNAFCFKDPTEFNDKLADLTTKVASDAPIIDLEIATMSMSSSWAQLTTGLRSKNGVVDVLGLIAEHRGLAASLNDPSETFIVNVLQTADDKLKLLVLKKLNDDKDVDTIKTYVMTRANSKDVLRDAEAAILTNGKIADCMTFAKDRSQDRAVRLAAVGAIVKRGLDARDDPDSQDYATSLQFIQELLGLSTNSDITIYLIDGLYRLLNRAPIVPVSPSAAVAPSAPVPPPAPVAP